MNSSKTASLTAFVALTAALGGCDKNQSSTPPAQPTASTPASPGTPAAAAPVVVQEMAVVAGTYHFRGDGNHPGETRDQDLILKPDGTAELDTTLVDTTRVGTAKTRDAATGTFTAGPDRITVTFTVKDGRPIPAADDKHMMKMKRHPGEKNITEDDGRTFKWTP